MSVMVAPVTAPAPVPATLAGTVLLAVKAEVATPASRTRDLRIAGSCSLSGSGPPGRGVPPVQRRLCHFVDALSSAVHHVESTPVPKEPGGATETPARRSPLDR